MSAAKVIRPDRLNQLAKTRASERGCRSLEEYVRLLIQEDSPTPIDAKLEEQLLQSLRSPARKITSQFWSKKRRKLQQATRRSKGG